MRQYRRCGLAAIRKRRHSKRTRKRRGIRAENTTNSLAVGVLWLNVTKRASELLLFLACSTGVRPFNVRHTKLRLNNPVMCARNVMEANDGGGGRLPFSHCVVVLVVGRCRFGRNTTRLTSRVYTPCARTETCGCGCALGLNSIAHATKISPRK